MRYVLDIAFHLGDVVLHRFLFEAGEEVFLEEVALGSE